MIAVAVSRNRLVENSGLTWRFRRPRTFQGGLFLPDEKAPTARNPIEELTVRWPLDVPLRHADSLPTQIVAREGQRVARGEVLAEGATEESLAVRSPVEGRVLEFGRAWTARGGFIPSVRIEPSESQSIRRSEAVGGGINPTNADVAALAKSAGIIDGECVPLHTAIEAAVECGVDTLIVNAMETEPNLTGDLRLLVERSDRLIETIGWLAGVDSGRLFQGVFLAVALRHRRIVRLLQRRVATTSRRIRVAVLEDKYPQCHPTLLCKVILGREPAPGRSCRDTGALVLPLATIAALTDAREGIACTSRVVTVSGDAVERPGNLVVPFGTPIHRLIEHVGLRRRPVVALAGGPMTGVPFPDVRAVTSADVAGVTLLSRVPRSEPIACVRCGWCVEDCPAGIDPRALSQLELRTEFSGSERSSLSACIECGICTYVCPSQLPLAEAIGQCRRRLDSASAGSS